MSIDDILSTVRGFDGVLELAPTPRSDAPPLAWGDHFFYYAPDRVLPPGQPYATVVTKDYPDDAASRLDSPGRWRVNAHVGRERFAELLGYDSRSVPDSLDYSRPDVLLPHPVYAALGWVAVVTPGATTLPTVLEMLRDAHDQARLRWARRVQTD